MVNNDVNGGNYNSLQNPSSLYNPLRSSAATPKSAVNAAPAGSTVKTLFLYDASFADFSDLLADAVYPGAKKVPIKTHEKLGVEVGKYATIETLVIFTHSVPGSLLINSTIKTTADVDKILAKTKTKVTIKIVFEGCSIMQDPVDTCKMIKSIVNPGAITVGYSYSTITQVIKFKFAGVTDISAIQAEFNKFDKKYWLKPLPKAKDAIGKNYQLGRRWFRDSLDKTVPEQVQRGILSYSELNRIEIKNLKEAKALKEVYDYSPITSGDLITVSNIAEIVKG